jgi:endonuclease/exonuclease/phosphatase family metal-dependent hydrolase
VGLFDSTAEEKLPGDRDISILTWNVGYCALGKDADFIMDGGGNAPAATKEVVQKNIDSVASALSKMNADVTFLQEVDANSNRSYYIDQRPYFSSGSSAFGINFKANFVPYPIPPIGKVDGGIETLSKYPFAEGTRIQLPCPFSWPVRLGILKRCLLLNRIPIEGDDHDLVLVNLHLEAYDSGEGKIAQTAMLKEILEKEVQDGNYVIAGGDFNQSFSNIDTGAYAPQEGKWQPGYIDTGSFGEGWQFLMDESTPSCRSLDQVYDGADRDSFQFYLIDGFIVSGNLKVRSFRGIDKDFVNSDHNPVMREVETGV